SIYGIGIETLIQAMNAVLSATTVLAGLVALRTWRRVRQADSTTGRRAAWMAIAGVITSCLFLILLLPSLLPAAFLTECARSL
ncbi:MAG: hypothetical protein ACRDJ5_08805, partial [Actinomycetota bacterium]